MIDTRKYLGRFRTARRCHGEGRKAPSKVTRILGCESLDPRLMFTAGAEAILLDFEFDGQVLTDTNTDYEGEIYKQLLYTIGQLNGENSVGRIGEVELSEIVVEEATLISDGTDGYRISYRAGFPVAWGQPGEIPTQYTFQVPAEVTWLGNMFFVGMHSDTCVWEYKAGLSPDTYYWYYRADAEGCELIPELTQEMSAVVTPGNQTSTDTFPEMHKIWEDGTLEVVAIFGAYSKGRIAHDLNQGLATDDAGIVAYNDFITAMHDNFGSNGMITDPPNVDTWTDANEVRFSFTFDGRPVVVNAFLLDSLATAGDTFGERYDQLSQHADLIAYNGHAGYGDTVRQLGQMGDWTPGQYTVFFMNACDTYAYGDGSIEKAHAAINSDDPTGSKHVDTIYNVMPSDFGASAFTTMTLISGVVDYSAPKSYETMLEEIHSYIEGNEDIYGQQLPIVVGDEDNEFFPWRDLDTLLEPDVVDPGNLDANADVNLKAGDANGDRQFNQLDIVQVLRAARYLSSEPATFEEGDWNADGVFDPLDIVAALQTGNYLQGPYAADALFARVDG